MIRRMVVVRSHEWLAESFTRKSIEPARAPMEATFASVPGVQPTGQYAAPLPRPRVGLGIGGASGRVESKPYVVPMHFDDEDAVARLKLDRRDEVLGVFSDPRIEAGPADCAGKAHGTHRGVARKLRLERLHRNGLDGRGVRIAVVDTGVSATGGPKPVDGVTYGWSPAEAAYVGGSAAPGHGTMCAWDAQLVAPGAELLDYALLQSEGTTFSAWLSDAVAAYADLLGQYMVTQRPLVVTNSWAVYDRSGDEPEGSPGNYSANPQHPFNELVRELVGAGVDVVFCAGNCGADCPDSRCGAGDVGPGRSIHGANALPDVLTVAGVTYHFDRAGYSSQGPAAMHPQKPDLAAYTQFRGSGVYPADNGTSAACPVAAGVVACLRSRLPRAAPVQIRAALQRTARDVNGGGFDHDIGFGVIRPVDAAEMLGIDLD